MTAIKSISDATFEAEVLNSKKPVLVDFWASWCPPCLAIAPHVERLADEHADRITVAKLSTEENQQVPMQYQIRSIPTLMLFQDGEVKKVIQGFRSKEQIEAELSNYIER